MADITRQSGTFGDVPGDLFRGFSARPVAYEGRPEPKIRIDVKEGD